MHPHQRHRALRTCSVKGQGVAWKRVSWKLDGTLAHHQQGAWSCKRCKGWARILALTISRDFTVLLHRRSTASLVECGRDKQRSFVKLPKMKIIKQQKNYKKDKELFARSLSPQGSRLLHISSRCKTCNHVRSQGKERSKAWRDVQSTLLGCPIQRF